MKNKIKTGRTLALIGGIVGIIMGVFNLIMGLISSFTSYSNTYSFYDYYYFHDMMAIIIMILILCIGVLDIVGSIYILKNLKMSDEELRENARMILVWGIIFLFTTWIIGGILLIISYILIVYNEDEKKENKKRNISSNDFSEIEKAFELKEKGIITEEEFEKIKRKVIDSRL